MIGLEPGPIGEIAVLGAHCDDIAIGAGGTLLTIARSNPGLRVRALVFSGGGTEREREELKALSAFCPNADVELQVLDVPDGRLPQHWGRVKNELSDFRGRCDPQLVVAPQRGDAHQDHRLVAELAPTEFRDHLILGYEILKWESDLPTQTHFQALTPAVSMEKVRLLHEHYPSQAERDWFDESSFLGLMRIRGVQCHAIHAEAFVVEKAMLRLGVH